MMNSFKCIQKLSLSNVNLKNLHSSQSHKRDSIRFNFNTNASSRRKSTSNLDQLHTESQNLKFPNTSLLLHHRNAPDTKYLEQTIQELRKPRFGNFPQISRAHAQKNSK